MRLSRTHFGYLHEACAETAVAEAIRAVVKRASCDGIAKKKKRKGKEKEDEVGLRRKRWKKWREIVPKRVVIVRRDGGEECG